ncbi:DUF502 domain-containing protein [Nitrospina gracilis]|uniref:DUF502 domain-containing protein n=1 Tax=Nitrospina gracilis TaxID=35801 RepID=UPI001F16483E|nr:putative membrane protein [Nitrospina gracilis Nb-211]
MKRFFKKNLIAGLLILFPVGLTIFVLAFVINLLDRVMAPWISLVIVRWSLPLPEDFYLPGLGFFLVCLFIFAVGLVATNFFGKKLVALGDRILHQTPIVRSVYTTIKKVVDSVSEADTGSFDQVVVVKYPHEGMRMFGLVAGRTRGEVKEHSGEDPINVFVPLIPNVTLGFYLVLPRKDVTPMDISVEEGMKYLMSFGLATGEGKKKPPPEKE